MLARQAVEGEGVLDRFLDPIDELLITVAPFGDPGGEIASGLLDISSVIEPAQLLQAVVVGLAREMVQGVAEVGVRRVTPTSSQSSIRGENRKFRASNDRRAGPTSDPSRAPLPFKRAGKGG